MPTASVAVKTWRFQRNLVVLKRVRQEVASFLSGVRFPQKRMNRFILCVDEAASNIVKYSSLRPPPSPPLTFKVEARCNDEVVKVIFKDNGIPWDPTRGPDIDLRQHVMEGNKGGFGLFILRASLDVLEYRYARGFNCFTLGMNLARGVSSKTSHRR